MLYRFPTKHVKSRKSARVGKVELLINMIQTAQWSEEEEEEEEEVGRVVLVCMCAIQWWRDRLHLNHAGQLLWRKIIIIRRHWR